MIIAFWIGATMGLIVGMVIAWIVFSILIVGTGLGEVE